MDTALRLLGVDPGGATGWSVVQINFHDSDEPYIEVVQRGQVGDPDKHEHHAELETIMQTYGPFTLIVCERFEHRNNEFAELVSLEYIGVVKAFCQRCHVPLVLQGSSEAKHWADNSKLAQLGFLISPLRMWKDTNDSMRHIVYFICCSNKRPASVSALILKARSALLQRLKVQNLPRR